MPIGLFIFTIDLQNNVEVKLKYPEDLQIPNNLYKIIDLSFELKEGYIFSSIIVGNSKIASIYSGSEFINLILKSDEDPIDFENILAYYYKKIKKSASNGQINEIIDNLFDQISRYAEFEAEQKLAIAYSDDLKNAIMEKLTNDLFITKNGLQEWLKEKLALKSQNVDPAINTLIKLGLLKICHIENSTEEYILCTGDIFITRKPPIEIILKAESKRIPEKIAKNYISKVKDFFKTYSPSLDDAKNIVEMLSDFYIYYFLKLLRLSPSTKKGLMRTGIKNQDLDAILEKLIANQVIEIIKDEKGNEFYFLLTDLCIEQYFPEYLLKNLLEAYNNNTVRDSVILELLIQLKDFYKSELQRKKMEKELLEEGREKEKVGEINNK